MHQNQILDGLGKSSETIRSWWMVSEDLLTPSKIRFNASLDGDGMMEGLPTPSIKTFRHYPSAMYGVGRPSETF